MMFTWKRYFTVVGGFVLATSLCTFGLIQWVKFDVDRWPVHKIILTIELPKPPKKMLYSYWRTGPIEVAKVFGRGVGCQDADTDLIDAIVSSSILHGLNPRLTAAVIEQESRCDPFAVSIKGAIGLMQVMPKIHKKQFDFTEINLFNEKQNIEVGVTILAELVDQYGEVEALRRYQGVGVGGVANYSSQVVARKEGTIIPIEQTR